MNMREEQGVAQVLAVISGKGGTGKTSLCAGIASCLAMDGLRVLCIDLDVGLRNLDIALGMQDGAVLPFTALRRGEYSLQQATQHPTLANLFLLTAPVTEDPETIDADAFGRLLDAARDAFDWILLDAPAGVGALFRMATRYADEAAVVALADPDVYKRQVVDPFRRRMAGRAAQTFQDRVALAAVLSDDRHGHGSLLNQY